MPDNDLPFLARLGQRFNPAERPGGSILGSGEEIDLSDASAVQDVLTRRQRWQYQALDANEACGELNYGVSQLAGAISRLRIYVADTPDSADSIPEASSEPDAAAVIDQLGSIIDRAELQRRIAEQMFITGEPYMIYNGEDKSWTIRSIEEVQPDGTSISLKDAPGDSKPFKLNPAAGDTWVRLLHQSARWASLATSHVRPILDDIDELMWWSAAGRAHSKNRLAINGALGIPQSLEAPIESEEDEKFTGSERWLRKFYNRGITTLKNPSAASAALPFLYTYPDNDQRTPGLVFTDMHRSSDDLIEQRTDRALQRIAQGINLPPEVILGVSGGKGGGSSHFTLQAITESLFIQHVEPPALMMLHALTQAWLRKILKKMGLVPQKYLLWYDSSNLIAKPDMSQAADFGVQNILINGKAWRRTRNFSEEDQPTPAEAAWMLYILQQTRGRIPPGGGQDGSVNPTMPEQVPPNSPEETPEPGKHAPKQMPAVPARGKGQSVLPEPTPISAAANGHTTEEVQLALLEGNVLLAQLQILGDEKVRRALEKAGNKLRSRANKNSSYKSAIRNVESENIAKTLGREACTKLGIDDLFTGCFDTAGTQFRVLSASVFDEPTPASAARFVEGLKLIAAEKLFSPPDFKPVVTKEFVMSCFQPEERT